MLGIALRERSFPGSETVSVEIFKLVTNYTGKMPPQRVPPADATTVISVGISENDNPSLPLAVELDTAFPNPSNGVTTIRYGLPESGPVSISVYDLEGRKVMTVVDGEVRSAGWHADSIDARHLASGIYVYRLVAGNERVVKKLTILR